MLSLSKLSRRDDASRGADGPDRRPDPPTTTAPTLSPGAITAGRVPDDVLSDPRVLRRALILALRDGMHVSEAAAERYLAAHEQNITADPPGGPTP